MLSKLIYKVNEIPIKNINKIFYGVTQIDTKVHMEKKKTSKNSQKKTKKKSYKGRLALSDIKTYYKAL